ncbi:hypothetical protein SEUBUCD646_0L04080 [Saccharomyces eubayanus]
MNYT